MGLPDRHMNNNEKLEFYLEDRNDKEQLKSSHYLLRVIVEVHKWLNKK